MPDSRESWRLLRSEIVTSLAQTMDAEEAVGRLAQLLSPTLADWCVITLVEDNDSRTRHRKLRDIGWWHADPLRRDLVREYAAERIAALRDASMLLRAIDTGKVVHVDQHAVTALSEVLVPGRALDVVTELAPSSLTVVPLQSRGRTLGALTLFNGHDRPALTPGEVGALVEIAGAAALALDNARLYRQQRDVALTFQQSLLTAPVEPDHMQVVVRYRPASEAARVGGDWYDAFMQTDGSTVLVIGDVVGHDVEAAALMAQLRSMLRAIAVVNGSSPAQVLGELDRAVRTLRIPAMATLVVARIEQTDDERERGITRVRWSSAGHLPPMALNPDGTVLPLNAVPTGRILGLGTDAPRSDSVVVLDRESTLLLYTDGLVERRDRSLRDGLAELQESLRDHADLDLDSLCDRLLEQLPAGPGDDDIALVGVRLHRQDRPRPPEAGPTDIPPGVPEE